MDVGGIVLSEVSQRNKNIVCFHLHAESKKQKMNITNQKQTHRYIEQTSGYQQGRGGVRGKIGEQD